MVLVWRTPTVPSCFSFAWTTSFMRIQTRRLLRRDSTRLRRSDGLGISRRWEGRRSNAVRRRRRSRRNTKRTCQIFRMMGVRSTKIVRDLLMQHGLMQEQTMMTGRSTTRSITPWTSITIHFHHGCQGGLSWHMAAFVQNDWRGRAASEWTWRVTTSTKRRWRRQSQVIVIWRPARIRSE